MAGSTRAMRRAIFERELVPICKNRLLHEIMPDDLRALCAKIVQRGAARPPVAATAKPGRILLHHPDQRGHTRRQQNRPKLAPTASQASVTRAVAAAAAERVLFVFMALPFFVDQTPRAYRLKAGNADLPISTADGTSPIRSAA